MHCRAVDSTGIKAEGEGEWSAEDQKTVWGTVFPTNTQAWRRETPSMAQDPHPLPGRVMRSMIPRGASTNRRRRSEPSIARQAIAKQSAEREITGSNLGDAPMLPELRNQIPVGVEIGSITADGAYDTRKCHDAVADRGAHAVRQGNGPPDPFLGFLTPAPQDCQAVEAINRRRHCPQRGLARIEIPRPRHLAKMERIPPPKPRRNLSGHCGAMPCRSVDALREAPGAEPSSHTFCECVAGRRMARDFDCQVAELQIRAAVLNGYTALAIPITGPMG